MKRYLIFLISAWTFSSLHIFGQHQPSGSDSITHFLTIPGIEISGQKSLPYMEHKLGSIEIQQAPVRDIGDYLRTVPNLSGVRKGGTGIDPVLRGFRYSQVNVMIDKGIKVEGGCPNRMDPTVAHMEPEDIQEINVTKGPYVLRYGPTLGGTISLNPFHPLTDKAAIHVKALSAYESNWDGHRQYLNINGGTKNLHYFISGGLKNFGNYTDGNGETVLSSFLKYNYSAGIGFSPAKKHHISIAWRESHGRDVKYPALPMDERTDDTRLISLDYSVSNPFGSIESIDVKLYQSDVYHEMDNHNRANYPATNAVAIVDAVNTGFRTEAKIKLGKSLLITGLDIEDIRKDGDRVMVMAMSMPGMPPSTMTKRTNLWYDAQIDNLGLFGEWHLPKGKVDWVYSLRADYNQASSGDTLRLIKEGINYFDASETQNVCLSASAGMSYRINEKTDLKISVGRGERTPNMTERYIKFLTVGYDNYDYLGDPQLSTETNNQADITLGWENKTAGHFYLNGFFSYVQNYITGKKLAPSVATPKTQGALGVKQFYNADYALFRGFEFGWHHALSKQLSAGLTAAYTYATLDEAVQYIISNNQVTGELVLKNDPLPEIPPLEANLFVDYRFFKEKLSARVHWRLAGAQEKVSDAMYEPATPGFGVVNASITYKPNRLIQFSGGVNNAFDKAYYEHLNRKIIGSTAKLYEPGRSFFVQAVFTL